MSKVQKHHVKARAASIDTRLRPTGSRALHHAGRHRANLNAILTHKGVRPHGVVDRAGVKSGMRKLDARGGARLARHASTTDSLLASVFGKDVRLVGTHPRGAPGLHDGMPADDDAGAAQTTVLKMLAHRIGDDAVLHEHITQFDGRKQMRVFHKSLSQDL